MKKLNLFGWSAIAVAVAFLAPGCKVDESYDLSNIDTEVTVLPGVEVPLPNFKEVKLKDLIKLETGGVVSEVSGKYVINYAVDPQVLNGFSINANDFKINASSNLDVAIPLNQTSIPDKTPLSIPTGLTDDQKTALAGLMGITDVNSFESLKSQALNFNTNIDFSINNFPTEIKAFKSCTLNGNLSFSLVPAGFPFSKFVLKQGTTITFPGFLAFASCNNADFDLSAGHILTANKDIDVVIGTGIQFQLALAGLDMGATGVATAGTLPLADNITIAGNIYLDPDWFNGPKTTQTFGTYEVTYVNGDCPLTGCKITANYTAADITLSSATIKADASAIPAFGTYGFDINGLPSFLTGEDVNIELNEVQLALNLASTLPFPVTLANGQLKALNGTTATHTYNLPSMVFAANATTGYSVGEHANGGTDAAGNTYVNLPGLGSILAPVPTRVEAAGFNVTIPEDWLTVESGVSYGGTLNVGINAPISFKSTSRVGFVIDADNVSLDLGDIPLEKASLSLTAENTIPLNFAIEVVAKDANKNAIPGVTATVDKAIASGHGTANEAVATPIKITLTIAKDAPAIKGLQLKLNATSDAGASQYPLEPEQGLHLVNVSLGLPDGVTMDLKNLGKKEE